MGSTLQRDPLSRSAIVAAAIALADEDGVGALTMRNVARQLDYEVMSLYNHVANKDEMLALMVDAVADEIDEPPDAAPLEAVRAMAVSTRAAFVRHPWASELWLRHLPGPARTRHMENLLRILHRSGLSSELAHHGFHAVNNHVLGYTLQELGMTLTQNLGDLDAKAREFLAGVTPEIYPYTVAHVRQHLGGDTSSSFELVLDLILEGLIRLQESP